MRVIARVAGVICLLLACAIPLVRAVDLPSPGKYQLETRLKMPNLDINLPAAATSERVCVALVADLFPVLKHPAFAGCRLTDQHVAAEGRYQLILSLIHI